MRSYSLQELANQIGGVIRGNADVVVNSIAPLDKAAGEHLTFISNVKYRPYLSQAQAGILVVSPADVEFCADDANLIIVENPYVAYARLAQYMDSTPKAAVNIAPSAVISETVLLGQNVSIGANAVIEAGAVIGDNAVIGAGCFIGQNAKIGRNTQLWANVSIYHEVEIGEDCLVQSGAVIGSDGFGYANERGQWIKIPQTGRVIIGNRVEIGACTCIDRGALDDTVVTSKGVEATPALLGYFSSQYARNGDYAQAQEMLNYLSENYTDSTLALRGPGGEPVYSTVDDFVQRMGNEINRSQR